MGRFNLKTARFSKPESRIIDHYLKKNPVFESFSSLARVATLQFINDKKQLPLVSVTAQSKRPSFLWDYNLSELEVREILSQPGLTNKKKWLMERILSQASYNEILSYLDVKTIKKVLPHLKLAPKIRDHWQYALKKWGSYG